MCEAFRLGKDIHTATAAKVYGIDESEVTKEMRYKAKSVNFGIIYGQGAFGLADNLGISRTEAKTIIDNYKKEFSGITTLYGIHHQLRQRERICRNIDGEEKMVARHQFIQLHGKGICRKKCDQFTYSGYCCRYDQVGHDQGAQRNQETWI